MKIPASASDPQAPGADNAAEGKLPAAAKADGLEARFGAPGTAHELGLAQLQRLLDAWRKHEAGTRLGRDPEELHQLRVSVRRIDATLSLFKHQLPANLVRARKTAKSVLRTLGAARDLDVLVAELARYCADLPEHERAAAEPLRALLEEERGRARARLVRALDSVSTRHWLETLARAGAENPAHGGETGSALSVMPERVRRRYRKLRKAVRALRETASMEDYHEVRRRAKQLRYAIESASDMLGKPADDLLKALRRLQDELGAQQDAYVAQNRLAAIAADPANGLPPATLFLMGRLAEHYSAVTTQTRKTLARSWRKVRSKRWKALKSRLEELHAGARETHAPSVAPATAPAPASSFLPASGAARAAPTEPRPTKH